MKRITIYQIITKTTLHVFPAAYILMLGSAVTNPTLVLITLYMWVFFYDAWTYWPAKGRVNALNIGRKKGG
jgi:hypothetical protein